MERLPGMEKPLQFVKPQQIRAIDRSEVQKHNTKESAWFTHGGYVYDVTSFLKGNLHPGGVDQILPHLGENIDGLMEDTDHSPYSYNLMRDFVIGYVKGEEQKETFGYFNDKSKLRGYTEEELRVAVDFSKPVLPQIASMGDKYWPWLHSRPVCHGDIIFPIKWIEACSRYPWWYIWVLWPPIFVWNLYTSVFVEKTPFITLGISFFIGVICWTLLEYNLHRFAFHTEVWTNGWNVFHFFAHGQHHLTPSDSSRLTFPPWFASVIAFVMFKVWRAVFTYVPGTEYHAVYAGTLLGYTMYDTCHYWFHHTEFNNKLYKYFKGAHLAHHYKNENMNFGVSSPLWDHVFGTYDDSSWWRKQKTV